MKEIRTLAQEFRVLPKSRLIEGYALLFETESRDLPHKSGTFREIIKRESLDGVLEKSDVLALYNHDSSKVLARNTEGKGTLKLSVDKRGLKYSFKAPKTALGDEVFDAIQRGDLRNSSFAFSVNSDGAKLERRSDGDYRIITKFERLFDVSPVWNPAYSDTSVAARSLDELFKKMRAEEEEEKEEVEEVIEDEKPDEEEVVEEKAEEVIEDEKPDEEEVVEEKVEEVIEDEKPDEEEVVEEKAEEVVEEEEEVELIEVTYDGKVLNIPKKLIEKYIVKEDEMDEEDLRNYFSNLDAEITILKK